MKIHVISLGCPKNLTDTEAVMGLLVAAGHELSEIPENADVIIINTCAFIGEATLESLRTIAEISNHQAPRNKLIVMGCLPKRLKHSLFKKFPKIDAIVGPGDLHKMLQVINKLGKGKQALLSEGSNLYGHDFPRVKATQKHYAYIKIADGCDNKCAYCVVWQIRGKYKSRPMESIVKEVKGLVKNGLKEAILVAQDTTMYGTDIYGKPSLHILLKKLAAIKGLEWIRIMYAHPAHMTKELIKVMKNEPKVCKYLDLPIQHACDSILRRMGRRINASYLRELIEELRREIPGIAIRTSVIVGFPGETDEDFKRLFGFIKEERFARLGVFKYSREIGTPAAKMRGHISGRVKEKRFHSLMHLQQKLSRESLKNMVGKKLYVLSEGRFGRSFMDAPDIDGVVKFSSHTAPGTMVPVRIIRSGTYDLYGRVVT